MAYTLVRLTIVRQQSSCNDKTTAKKIKFINEMRSEKWISVFNLPLFDRQILSIPFRCNAIRANSQNDSLILKSHSGDISKQAILFLDAYNSACFAATCLLNAKCNLLPTNTFGTPGAC